MSTGVRAVAVAVVYFAAARYVVALHDLAGLGALFWPAAGVTATGLLLSPRRMWPAILAAVGSVELANNLLSGFELVPSLLWAVANVVEQSLAAWLIQRWQADRFTSVRAVAGFLAAACTAPVLGGAIGAIGTTLYVSPLPYLVIAWQWTTGDALGILTVVPVGLVLCGRLPRERLLSVEGLGAVVTVVLACVLVFGVGTTNPLLAERYLVLIPMLWAAARLGVAGAAVSVFVVAQLGSGLHALGSGPFAGLDTFTDAEQAAQLKLFLATVTAASLLLASRSQESAGYQDLAAARERLIAAVSHELRTPLTPIVGFSELLLRRHDELDAHTRQAAGIIHRNAQHLTALVDQLLQASRLRRGTLPTTPEAIRLRPLLEELVRQWPDDAIELGDIPAGAQVIVDRVHLIQIVTNLLDNALRHGAPPVHVFVDSDHRSTRLSIVDHGDGVPGWFTSQLFDDFAQATSGDLRGTLGLGLGLPISRTLAEANGGELDYHDTRHGGACFTLRLPTATAARTAPRAGQVDGRDQDGDLRS